MLHRPVSIFIQLLPGMFLIAALAIALTSPKASSSIESLRAVGVYIMIAAWNIFVFIHFALSMFNLRYFFERYNRLSLVYRQEQSITGG